jgi:hypothetical protein
MTSICTSSACPASIRRTPTEAAPCRYPIPGPFIARRASDVSTVERVQALAYRAELAYALDDPATAGSALAELDNIRLGGEERDQLGETLAAVEDLRRDAASRGTSPT